MNGKELKEEFKTKHGLSEMNGNITNYSEWLEDKLIALTKAENLPILGVSLRFSKEELEMMVDAIETKVAVLDWDNYDQQNFDNPREQERELYTLISKINEC